MVRVLPMPGPPEATGRACEPSLDPAAKRQMRTEVHTPKEADDEHYNAELAGEAW
jgi:hypothetical protein